MANQGAIGRYHDVTTSGSYGPAAKHYTRAFPRGDRWGYSGIADSNNMVCNTSYTRAAQHYTRKISTLWQNAGGANVPPIVSFKPQGTALTFLPLAANWWDLETNGANNPFFFRKDGYIQGVVKDSTVPQPGVICMLFLRSQNPPAFLGVASTDSSGTYRFDKLDTTFKYLVIMLDPPGGNQNNAQRLDYLTPTAY